MALVERRSLENVSFENSSDTQTNYKKLYHESVERYSVLQSQLESYSSLITKMGKIKQLKSLVLSSLSEKQLILEQQSQELDREKKEWKERLCRASEKERELDKECIDLRSTCDLYRTEHAQSIRVCGRLVAQVAMVTAHSRLQQEEIDSLKAKVSKKSSEVQKWRKTVSKCSHSLQRSRQEFKESLDFSEAERMTLAETNAELDVKISTLTNELTQVKEELKEKRGQLRETEERLRSLQKEEEDKPTAEADSTCGGCGQLKQDLDSALRVLNDQSCAKYGDLLRQNFSLTQKLKGKEEELAKGIVEYKRLCSYTQDYKVKSKQKADVLKQNLRKADEEISELDHIIDQVRSVMHREIDAVKHSPALVQLIRELDGIEAPNSY